VAGAEFATHRCLAAVAGFPYNKLMSRTLYMQVLDYDRFTRDDPIGEVCLPLCDISLAKEQTFWRTLQPCKGHTVSLATTTSSYRHNTVSQKPTNTAPQSVV